MSKYMLASSATVAYGVEKSTQLGQQILNSLSGTAASDKQAATIREFTPEWDDNNENFYGKLNNLRAGIQDERDAWDRAYTNDAGQGPKNINFPWRGRRDVEADKKDLFGK